MSTLSNDRRLSLFRRMLEVRRFEEGAVELNSSGQYVGHCHVSIGQEATCAAIADLMRPGDLAADHHRNHGHYIALGLDPGTRLCRVHRACDRDQSRTRRVRAPV